jgi:ubiquitin-protein ligase E3 A
MQSFRISYKDVFGIVYHHDLKVKDSRRVDLTKHGYIVGELQEDGASIMVNRSNRQEFVDLYADFLLNESIGRQFAAFRRGFAMVTDESPLGLLFRPEEVEQLVCGSRNFDFEELQNATEYDGGFTAQSETINHFWLVAFSFREMRSVLG